MRRVQREATEAELIAARVSEAFYVGDETTFMEYADPDIILSSFEGVAYGREAVNVALLGMKRHQLAKRDFQRRTQVQHCVDSGIVPIGRPSQPELPPIENPKLALLRRRIGLDRPLSSSSSFNEDGYDAQGYAQFERYGKYANGSRAIAFGWEAIRETVVVRQGKVVLFHVGPSNRS
jgi:hypothetical protein